MTPGIPMTDQSSESASDSSVTPEIIKVAIIEDQRDIREGLAMMFKFTGGYRCTGCYRSMEEALDKIKTDPPDVTLVDIGLPGMNGIDGIRILKEKHPQMLL